MVIDHDNDDDEYDDSDDNNYGDDVDDEHGHDEEDDKDDDKDDDDVQEQLHLLRRRDRGQLSSSRWSYCSTSS